ncbi:MAG: ATP-binding protein [Planctomycetia bacterium]
MPSPPPPHPKQPADDPEAGGLAPAVRARVLVLEDEPAVLDMLLALLADHGCHVTGCATLAEAGARAAELAPHVVLTDLGVDGASPLELVARLQRAAPATVVVALTGQGTVETTVDLMRAGAFGVLTKPCSSATLAATVEKAFEHQQALAANLDLRERLRVQDKLAMIGKLAAGVAHEINNPLDATLRCVRMLRDRTQDDAEAREIVELAHAGLLRMADIVKSLLTFSRNAAVEQAPRPLATLVEEAITSVRLALDAQAPRFERHVAPACERMPLPRGLYQVLANLLRNAADATGPRGTVRVGAERRDDRLLVTVADDGPGIPAHVLPRVFEPFFTTKEPGKGTGLGLPISARMVEKFGGAIRLECPPGGGTVATINLPALLPAERTMQEVP